MVAQKNIIKKVEIGVNTPSLENGLQLKDGLDTFFKEQIFPEMDNYFNSFQKNKSNTIRIDSIAIEISLKENSSMIDLKFLIISELKNKINAENISINSFQNFKIVNSAENETAAFFHFLNHGTLPWWFEEKTNIWEEFLNNLPPEKEFSKKLKALLEKEEIRKRLIFQFDNKQLFQIVSSVLMLIKKGNNSFKILKNIRNQFWEAVLSHSINNEKALIEILKNTSLKDVEKILKIANEIFGINIQIDIEEFAKIKATNKELLKKANSEKTNNIEVSESLSSIEKDGILLRNAGLILLHPFLKMFFEKLDFLSGKHIKTEKVDEAIHLLHYLSTGKEQTYEHELVFEKFLCNVSLHQPINRHVSLSKEQKISCEVLLQAVLEHWSALKSKSTKIIQNEFLQREGKLIITEEKQTLIVQRKTQDILLEKLPWSIHLIKIPWKEKILFVEW
ncbi:MAG: hypothetical protein JJE55_01655 [Flavobacteriaceae bacterium]|nr:hypothetical protein [Flavobacteriaceae bacterium]